MKPARYHILFSYGNAGSDPLISVNYERFGHCI
jgi:hypothetical protein